MKLLREFDRFVQTDPLLRLVVQFFEGEAMKLHEPPPQPSIAKTRRKGRKVQFSQDFGHFLQKAINPQLKHHSLRVDIIHQIDQLIHLISRYRGQRLVLEDLEESRQDQSDLRGCEVAGELGVDQLEEEESLDEEEWVFVEFLVFQEVFDLRE